MNAMLVKTNGKTLTQTKIQSITIETDGGNLFEIYESDPDHLQVIKHGSVEEPSITLYPVRDNIIEIV